MTEQPHDEGRLGRIAVIVGLLAGIAAIVGVVWTILTRETTDVADYRSAVSATCAQVRSITTAEAPFEVIAFEPGSVTPIIADKQALVNLVRTRFDLAKSAFEALKAKPFPTEVASPRDVVVVELDAWYEAAERYIDLLRERLRRGDPTTRLDELSVESGYANATIVLGSALSTLAADTCQLIGPAPP